MAQDMEGRVRSSHQARLLIRALRLRLVKAGGGHSWVRASYPRRSTDPVRRESSQVDPDRAACQSYAPSE